MALMSGRGRTLTDVTSCPGPHDHLVTFYESDSSLVQTTAAFLSTALTTGRPAIAVATREHLDAIRAALAVRAAHPAGGAHHGQLVLLDAHETLDRLMVDGRPDPEAFETLVTGMLDHLAGAGQPRIFGEMVALLWEEGDLTGALALEDLWNDLGRSHSFQLSCAYPIRSFGSDEDAAAFREVCDRHSSVSPAESYSNLRDEDARLRHVAELQQEATAGTSERAALERKQDELESALARLRESDRLRGEFVAMVAHDIRSPAALVSSSLELLRHRSGLSDEDADGLLASAAEGARSVQRLADDVLTMAQLEAGEFDFSLGPVEVADVVARATRSVRTTTSRRVEVDLPARCPTVLADADRQVQILVNLLSNAMKFSPTDTTVRVGVEESGRHVVISVSDQGVGISPQDQAKLFRPFSRLPAHGTAAGGSGLGLAIAKALIEGQGGTVRLDSRPGRGTKLSYTVVAVPEGAR
jgi:signal transduction histidine kinase